MQVFLICLLIYIASVILYDIIMRSAMDMVINRSDNTDEMVNLIKRERNYNLILSFAKIPVINTVMVMMFIFLFLYLKIKKYLL